MKIWQAATPARARTIRWRAGRIALVYGQMANVLGRVDPKTGNVKEYPLKTAHSGPHGLVEDSDGNIWYTGNTGALIGKLDPKTGAVTEYPMPDPNAKDPHTLIFDKAAFSGLPSRTPTASGGSTRSRARSSCSRRPRPKSRPYGMALDSKGNLFVVQFAPTRWRGSIRRRWKSASTPSRIRLHVRGASPSPATTPSGTPTIRADTWAISTRRRAR